MTDNSPFVLMLDNTSPNSATARIKASGGRYIRKRLQSKPDNWEKIQSLLTSPDLICVIGKLNTAVFNQLVSDQYSQVALPLLDSLSKVPHLLFAHESVLTGIVSPTQDEDQVEPVDDLYDRYGYPLHFGFNYPSTEVRNAASQHFADRQIQIVPCSTNAEFEVMSDGFVADSQRNLLFRVYVPAGRLYANEADKLLSLFRDWLVKVGQQGVRQDGYETGAGHMYEFYGDGRPRAQDLSQDFHDFSGFLDLCIDDPDAAQSHLASLGFDQMSGSILVSRYAKECRRLHLDLKQERESKVIAIRHRIEAEVLEASIASGEISLAAVSQLIEDLVPRAGLQLGGLLGPPSLGNVGSSPINIQLNQQIISSVEGTVVQSVQGTAALGLEATELLDLVTRFGGADSSRLTSALYELEDPDAGPAHRLGAKQLLKGFLIRLGGVVQDVGLAALNKYVDTKLGV